MSRVQPLPLPQSHPPFRTLPFHYPNVPNGPPRPAFRSGPNGGLKSVEFLILFPTSGFYAGLSDSDSKLPRGPPRTSSSCQILCVSPDSLSPRTSARIGMSYAKLNVLIIHVKSFYFKTLSRPRSARRRAPLLTSYSESAPVHRFPPSPVSPTARLLSAVASGML